MVGRPSGSYSFGFSKLPQTPNLKKAMEGCAVSTKPLARLTLRVIALQGPPFDPACPFDQPCAPKSKAVTLWRWRAFWSSKKYACRCLIQKEKRLKHHR